MLGNHGKTRTTKLKNSAVSFWCFLSVLIAHANMMEWSDTLTFIINGRAVNLIKQFIVVPLDAITARANERIAQAAMPPPATRTTRVRLFPKSLSLRPKLYLRLC